MENTNGKSRTRNFLEKIRFLEPEAPVSKRQGSVDSAGGTSPLAGVVPPSRDVGTTVTVESALSMSAVYRAVSIIATAISQMDISAWRGHNNPPVEPKPSILNKPDFNTTLTGFLKRTVISMALHGNCYWRLYKADNGQVVNIEVLNPALMSISRNESNGHIEYRYYGYFDGKERVFGIDDIKHLRMLEIPGYDYGLGPIQACRMELTGALDLRDYAGNWFSKGAIPTGVLSSSDYIDSETATEYRARWEANQANRGVAVPGNGMQYTPVILSPGDAQFLENQQFSITQISRLFGIPANYMLAEIQGNAMTYQNMEHVDTSFVKYTLQQYISEIESALTDVLPRGTHAHLNIDTLMRPDHKTRAEIQKTYVEMGVLIPEEVRDKEHFGPMPPKAPMPAPHEQEKPAMPTHRKESRD